MTLICTYRLAFKSKFFFSFLSLCFHTAALVTIKQSYYTYQLVTTLILYPRDSIQDYNKQGKITALVLVW